MMTKWANTTVYGKAGRKPLVLLLSLLFFASALVAATDAEARWSKWFKRKFVVEVVSGAADQVTGGDARLHIEVPGTVPLYRVAVQFNGADQSDRFIRIPGTRTLTGIVDGLKPGKNKVKVKVKGGRGRWWLPRPVKLQLQES